MFAVELIITISSEFLTDSDEDVALVRSSSIEHEEEVIFTITPLLPPPKAGEEDDEEREEDSPPELRVTVVGMEAE